MSRTEQCLLKIVIGPSGGPETFAPILANLLLQEVFPLAEAEETPLDELEFYHYGYQEVVVDVSILLAEKLIEHRHAREILHKCFMQRYVGYDVPRFILETKLLEEAEGDELLALVREALAANPGVVAQVKAGKEKAIGSLIGPILKKHKADPKKIQELLKQEIFS